MDCGEQLLGTMVKCMSFPRLAKLVVVDTCQKTKSTGDYASLVSHECHRDAGTCADDARRHACLKL